MFAEWGHTPVLPRIATHDGGVTRQRAGLCVAALMVVGLVAFPSVREHALSSEVSLIVTYVAAAAGAAAAIFVEIAGRLTQHARSAWISAALSLYSVVIVPFATVQTVTERDEMTLSAARLVSYWTVVALLLLAIRPPRVVGRSASWALAGFGLLLTLATADVATVAPRAIQFATSPTWAHVALAITAGSLVTALAVNGWQERKGPFRRVGQGLLVIAAPYLYWIVAGFPAAEPDIAVSGSRLFGLALVLLAAVQLARESWRAVRVGQSMQQTELEFRAANLQQVALETAERDHEIRNGVAGLAGVHLLLENSLDAEEAERLRHAVASELSRLEAILERPYPEARPEGYLVAPVLADLVALRRSAGRDVELDVDGQLRASGSPEVLAQVVTNLLANCERHASGSAVRIRAGRDQDRVYVEVADDGPGVPSELRWNVLERGVRSGRTGGSGLGLHICRRLLEAQGGTLQMVAPHSGHTGCTVLIELPTALDCAGLAQPLCW